MKNLKTEVELKIESLKDKVACLKLEKKYCTDINKTPYLFQLVNNEIEETLEKISGLNGYLSIKKINEEE